MECLAALGNYPLADPETFPYQMEVWSLFLVKRCQDYRKVPLHPIYCCKSIFLLSFSSSQIRSLSEDCDLISKHVSKNRVSLLNTKTRLPAERKFDLLTHPNIPLFFRYIQIPFVVTSHENMTLVVNCY